MEFLVPENDNNVNGAKSSRFANLSESEMQQILADRHSAKTKQTTNWSVGTFKGRL